MDRRSPVVVSQSHPERPLCTPVTALPPFTPALRRTSSSGQRSVVSHAESRAQPVTTPRSSGGSDGAAEGALPMVTPSFANRGFISRFSHHAVQSTMPEACVGMALTAAARSSASQLRGRQPRQQGTASLWEEHGRRLSAPGGYTETAASDGASPSFAIQAPSGLTDSEDESDSEEGASTYESRRRSSLGAGVRPLSPAEVALTELTDRLEKQLRVHGQLRVGRLERVLLDLDVREQLMQRAAQQAQQQALEEAARADEAQHVQQVQQRRQILSALRAEHERKAREAQQQLERKEEAAKAEAQRREREAQQTKQAAEEAKRAQQAQQEAAKQAQQGAARKAQESAAAQAQSVQQAAEAAAAKKQQQAEKAKAAAAAAAAPANEPFPARVSSSAAQWQQHCAVRLKAAQDIVRPFVEDRAMRDKKRSIDKFVTLNVQQISATLNQVQAKGRALVNFISQQQGAQRVYALLTLANKLISQCEAQVTRLHSFAFPTAEVAVAVAAAHPDFVELLVGRLQQSGKGDEDDYLKRMGYKFTTDEDTGQVTKETTDEYVGRMQGYLLLLAAITQSDNPANPHGLAQAWAYLARLLNALPANRITATALDAFLKVAGYRLASTYKGQFMKMLQYIDREFLGDLSKQNHPDARAVYTRIQTYLKMGRFRQPPEGREMPQSDASSYDRA